MFNSYSNLRRNFVIVLFLVFSNLIWAQQNGFNYKVLIKDNLGNVITNQSVTIQLTILEDATQVYQETHTPTTDGNGLAIITIGSGTTSDTFLDIVWSKQNHNLNTQIDIGSGLVDLGTTPFQSVPYAANVSGLEALDEGNGIGWRLKGFELNNYGNIGENAIDLSYSNLANNVYGATGNYSLASGFRARASGINSVAIGSDNLASGSDAVALGKRTTASGKNSFAAGLNSIADSELSTAIGRNNLGGGDPDDWVETDPLFEIGNGTSVANRSNALMVLKNGTITAPSFDLAEITDDKALITKEYADINLTASGLEALDEGNGLGWRLKGFNPDNYGNLGENAVDLSYSEFPSDTNGATAENAIAMGLRTEASGDESLAVGRSTVASGNQSIALGSSTTASGNQSAAMGSATEASGVSSIAFGILTDADSYASFVLGRHNTGGGTPDSWEEIDPLFEIGNGTSNINKSNALTILKNGTITAPSFDLAEITDNKALITKEYADNNLITSGLEAIDEGNGIGWRLKGTDPNNYGDIGSLAVDLSYSSSSSSVRGATGGNSFAAGRRTEASGDNSTAIGNNTKASGENSTAIGNNTEASGSQAFAIGNLTTASGSEAFVTGSFSTASGNDAIAMGDLVLASGDNSIAMGESSNAIGENSIAIGSNTLAFGDETIALGSFTRADAFASTAIGSRNIAGGTEDSWVETDPLFEVGNGVIGGVRSNALTILKNGKTGLGINRPNGLMHLLSNSTGTVPQLEVTETSASDGARITFNNTEETDNYWTLYGRARDDETSSRFNIFHEDTGNVMILTGDGNVGIGRTPSTDRLEVEGDASKTFPGSWSANSDERLKKNIKTINSEKALQQVLQLRGVTYEWNDDKTGTVRPEGIQIGFIAQELMQVFPTKVEKDALGFYKTAYGDYDAVFVQAFKALNNKIETLEAENQTLKNKLKKFEQLEARLSALENKNSSTTLIATKQ